MRVLSTLFIWICFAACNKEILSYTFTGKVTDRTGNPVAGATVELDAYYNSTNAISPGGLYKLAATKTNNSGEFKVSFKGNIGIRNYEVRVFASNYYPFRDDRIDVNNLQNNNLIYNPSIYKIATIKISFTNTSPVSVSDEFHVFQESELSGDGFDTFIERQFTGGTFNELEHKYVGNSIQGYELTRTKGDTYTFVNWDSKKNGVIVYKRDSVFIASGTQGNYTINY